MGGWGIVFEGWTELWRVTTGSKIYVGKLQICPQRCVPTYVCSYFHVLRMCSFCSRPLFITGVDKESVDVVGRFSLRGYRLRCRYGGICLPCLAGCTALHAPVPGPREAANTASQ